MDSERSSISSLEELKSYSKYEAPAADEIYSKDGKQIDGVDTLYNIHGTLSRTKTREIEDTDVESEAASFQSCDNQKDTAPYSLLSYSQKWMMVMLLTICGFWSSLGSPIYYPALKQLEKQFNVDENLVNVTVVIYLLFQGIAPTVSGGLADKYGRRPVILIGMLIYVIASIGLACANSYGLILFLRCLQSTGISPIIAISSGCVGDFTGKSERGTFVGAVSGLVLLGQAFGSLIGAALAATWDWRAIFWFLAIGCGASFVIGFILLPETKRTLVGNLSIRPKNFINRAPLFLSKNVQKRFKYDNPDYETLDTSKPVWKVLDPFKIIVQPEILFSLFPGGLQFALWTIMLASISSQLSDEPYDYKLITIGISYLPAGIGGLLGSLVTGRVIDIYYKSALRKFEQQKEDGQIGPDETFNIFRARLIATLPQNFLAVIVYTLFGWNLDQGLQIESILIVSFFCSYCTMSTLSTSSTLLVDLYPGKSSTATSCFNFIRCTLSAIFMGCLADMQQSITLGGTFTVLTASVLICNFLMYIPIKYGMQWRAERAIKVELKAQAAIESS